MREGAPRPAAEGGRRRPRRQRRRGRGAAAPETPPKPVRIDFDKLQQRIVALPLPARAYLGLEAGQAGNALRAGTGGRRRRARRSAAVAPR